MAWISEYQRWLSESESLNNARMVHNQMKLSGWSDKSIAALCGNMRHESSINPDMYEYGYDWSEDRGYGLVQWTPRSKYWDWATNLGLDQRLGTSQVARILYEGAQNIQWISVAPYNMTFNQFKTNSNNWSVDYLTEAFCWSYERPLQSAGEASMPDRKSFANLAYQSFAGILLVLPISGATPSDITSPYGWRTDPISGEPAFHDAIDFGFPCGTPLRASAAGTVILKVYPNPDQDYGDENYLWIDLGGGYVIRYHHMKSIAVDLDQVVTADQVVGSVGSTGYSTGCHLHFSLYYEGSPMDPYDYLFNGQLLPIDGGPIPVAGDYPYIHTNRRKDMRRWKRK